MLNLNGKKILLIGASGRIGKEAAILLSKLGAKLVLSGTDSNKLDNTFNLLEGIGHHRITFDIKNINKIDNFIENAVNLDDIKLDGLVYCAGIMDTISLENTNFEFLYNMMLVNYFGFVEVVRHFSNTKNSNGGSIVTISSYSSINGDVGELAYSASKGAIDSSIVVMAKELYSKNIRVNAIRPSLIEKDNFTKREQLILDIMETGPIKLKNIAEQIAFLLSDSSSGVYGRCFDVRGYLV